jgi:uncharacterized membrane protein
MYHITAALLQHGPMGPMGPHSSGWIVDPVVVLGLVGIVAVALFAYTYTARDTDTTDQLEELKQQYINGVIDESEFEAQCDRVLHRRN